MQYDEQMRKAKGRIERRKKSTVTKAKRVGEQRIDVDAQERPGKIAKRDSVEFGRAGT
jgi:hypothetical protein